MKYQNAYCLQLQLLHKLDLVSLCLVFQSQDKETGGLNPEPCPICARPLGQEVRGGLHTVTPPQLRTNLVNTLLCCNVSDADST